jgi:anti-sigma regulatory factor (Ser/Thr protein kinase)
MQLAAEELFTNLVKYSRGGRESIRVDLSRQADRLSLRLVDEDVDDFDPAQAPPVDVAAPLAERRAGGLGLYLVHAYVDDLTYTYEARTLTITATKSLEAHDV